MAVAARQRVSAMVCARGAIRHPPLPPLAPAAPIKVTLSDDLMDAAHDAGAARHKAPLIADAYTLGQQVYASLPLNVRAHISLLDVVCSLGAVDVFMAPPDCERPAWGGVGGSLLACARPRPPAQPLAPTCFTGPMHPATPTRTTAPCRRPRVTS
jgi:hypothetical protein